MAVEKHLLQNWQKWVLLLRLPAGLGWQPFLLGLPGKVQSGARLGEVAHGLVGDSCHWQLGVCICKEPMACVSTGRLAGGCHN